MTISLLHGFMGAPSDWDFVRNSLADFTIVTPKIRPASEWDAGVKQLHAEIPKDSILVGYSMGARLSLALAIASPGRYRGLVFCSGNPGIEEEQQRLRRYESDCRIAEQIDTADRQTFLEKWYRSAVFQSLSETVRQEEIARKLAYDADDWSQILKCYSVAKQPNYWPRLAELRMPCLAIAGLQDTKYASIATRMKQLPGMEARVVATCGHIVHHEQPHVFLQILREFLNSLE